MCMFINLFVLIALTWILLPEPPAATVAIPFVEDFLLSKEYAEAENKMTWLRRNLVLNSAQIAEVAHLTVGQRRNALWSAARKLRFTASNFGGILSAAQRNRLDNFFPLMLC